MPNVVAVKGFDHAQIGAPQLSGVAGAGIALLDAVLVNGFNLKALDGLSVTANVATAVVSGGHPYRVDDVVLLAGQSDPLIVGEFRVTEVTGTIFKFVTTGIPDGPIATPGTAKIAPLGWQKLYAGTNKAVYKRTDPAAPAAVLRVDDSDAKFMRARLFEAMTDVDSGTGPAPTDSQFSGGLCWYKSNSANATLRPWQLFGDALRFVFLSAFSAQIPYADGVGFAPYAFGAMRSERAADAYPDVITGQQTTTASWPNEQWYGLHAAVTSGSQPGAYISRPFTQVGGAVPCHQNPVFALDISGGDASTYPVFPNPVNNALELAVIDLREGSATISQGDPRRGTWPGMYFVCHRKPLQQGAVITDHPDFPGRRLIVLATPHSSGNVGRMVVDATGPWT